MFTIYRMLCLCAWRKFSCCLRLCGSSAWAPVEFLRVALLTNVMQLGAVCRGGRLMFSLRFWLTWCLFVPESPFQLTISWKCAFALPSQLFLGCTIAEVLKTGWVTGWLAMHPESHLQTIKFQLQIQGILKDNTNNF